MHTRVRGVISSPLSPQAVQLLKRRLNHKISIFLDAISEKCARGGKSDIIKNFAGQICIQIIGNLLGTKSERWPRRDWSLSIPGAFKPGIGKTQS